MKKILILLFFTLFLLAREDLQPLFKDGLKAFKSSDYKEAYIVFDKLFKTDSANPQFNYYLGRSAFALELYEKALGAFDRVLIIDENHIRSKLERGRSYVALKMYDEAKIDLEEVLNSNPPKEVKANIKILLELMDKKEKRSFINYFLTIGVGYDTNINSNPAQEDLIDYLADSQGLPKDNIETDGEIKDKFATESLNIHHIYDFGKRGHFFIDNSLNIYNQNYLDNSNFDILFTSFSSGVGYAKNGLKIVIPIYYDKVLYGSNSLLDSIVLAPRLSKKISKSLYFNSYIKFQRKFYSKSEDEGRDSNIRELGVGFSKIINSHLITFNYSFANENKNKSNDIKFIDKDLQVFKIGYATDIANLLNLNLQYSLRKSKYDSIVENKYREDNYHSYFIKLSKNINKKISLNTSYNYIEDDSNYIPMIYDKDVYLINLNINF